MRRFIQTIAISLVLFAIISCEKKEDTPLELVCNVTSTNVTVHGGNDGTITVIVLKGNGDYIFTLNDNPDVDGKFQNLSAGNYNLRVTDAESKEFLKSITITEPSMAPSVETGTATVTSLTDVTLNGKINPNGYVTTSAYFEYGESTTYGTNINLPNVNGSTLTSVSGKIVSGLSNNTIYHYRLVAINSGGTAYGNDSTFNTFSKPTINSVSTSDIGISSATFNCNVNTQGSLTKIYFEYGTTASYGSKTIEYTCSINYSNVDINSTIINLTPNTVYHYRLVATNDGGTTTSSDMTFNTSSWKVGDEMFGGVVFYVDGSGQHGKVVSKTDESTAMTWNNANNGVLRNGATWVLPTWDEIKLVYDNETTLQISSLSIIYRYWTNSDVTYTSASTFKTPNLKYSDLKTEEYLIRFITTF